MKKFYLLFLFGISFSALPAQPDTIPPDLPKDRELHRSRFSLALDLILGFPAGHFKSEIGLGIMPGKSIGLLCRLGNTPVELGMRFSAYSYDHIRREFEDSYVQKTKNKIWFWNGAVRYSHPTTSPLSFYMEGSMGWRRYYTKTYSKETGILALFSKGDDNPRFNQKKLHSEWDLVFGGAIGMSYRLKENLASSVYAQLGFDRSHPGDFYARITDAPIQEDPLTNYTRKHAALTMISVKVGVLGIISTYRKKKTALQG